MEVTLCVYHLDKRAHTPLIYIDMNKPFFSALYNTSYVVPAPAFFHYRTVIYSLVPVVLHERTAELFMHRS